LAEEAEDIIDIGRTYSNKKNRMNEYSDSQKTPVRARR